jgi:hypothetical protein
MTVGAPFTLRELQLMFQESTPDRIRLNMILANDHGERVRQVEAAIDWIAQERP